MRCSRKSQGYRDCLLAAALASSLACTTVNAAVALLGVQYQQDDWLPEFNCIWKDRDYPTSCSVNPNPGCNVHAFLKNTGGSAVTVSSVRLAGYDLGTVLKLNTTVHDARSIFFYWDNPPQDILNAGEPVWYKVDPGPTIPAGGVAHVVVRLRQIPVTRPVSLTLVTSGGTINAAIPVDADAPQLASVGFWQDRTKVYLHWRRNGGAAPASVWMDGINVTANATTVGDPGVNFAATVLSFPTPLANMSYHVYQGVYADGATATASLRTWVNKFIHATYNTFDVESSPAYTIEDWIAESSDHGINSCQVSVGKVVSYLNTPAGSADMLAREYGYISGDKTKFDTAGLGPDMFFINDEVDAEDANMERTHCGTGTRLPCGRSPMGILAMRTIEQGEALRAIRPLTPTSVNMDGAFKPENYYAYGQAVDILQVDPYYQRRLQDAYWRDQHVIPVYEKATYIYAVSKAVARAAEPNPSNVILYSCSWKCTHENACDPEYVNSIWPYPTPEAKRIEVYYALAAGAKGLCYWWLNWSGWPAHGLGDQSTQAARNLWKEIGLYGNEIKTVAPILVTSHPVDMTLSPSSNVWAKALASGTDTIILLAVNDDYYNDFSGCHYTPVPNATVTATLPSWMRAPAPSAFEVRPSGLHDVTTSLAGSDLTIHLGTLNLTRMIVITNNPTLRPMIQQRYEEKVRPGVCAFAPEHCLPQNVPPGIVQHPMNQVVVPGGSTVFTVVASGSSPLSYEWYKDNSLLADGGHYSGCTTAALTVSSADDDDVAGYHCVVANPYGTAPSNAATLMLGTPSGPTITQHPSDESVAPGGTASFTVVATGTPPLSYEWQKNQADLANEGHYSGVTTPALTITEADGSDVASYRCVVSDAFGSATSNAAALTLQSCLPSAGLENGDFENWPSGLVAPGWTGAYSETVANQFVKSTAIVRPGSTCAQGVKARDAIGAWAHVYQAFDTAVGDALTVLAYAYPTATSTGVNPQIGVNTSSARPNAWLRTLTSFPRDTWCTLGPVAFNATGATTYLFLDVKRVGAVDTTTYWDDVTVYHAYVPPMPMISQATSATLEVNVDPGCNSNNSAAQYAISIGGGGHTLGNHWVQPDGSVSTFAVWQTDAEWAAQTVTGLAADTSYSFQVKARYSGTYTQESTLGPAAVGVTTDGTITPSIPGDFDQDRDVDMDDFGHLQACLDPATGPLRDPHCADANLDQDPGGRVNQNDLVVFIGCLSGPGVTGDPDCGS
jgi:hypothetical protein